MTVWDSLSAFRAATMQRARVAGCDKAYFFVQFASGFDAGDQGRLASRVTKYPTSILSSPISISTS